MLSESGGMRFPALIVVACFLFFLSLPLVFVVKGFFLIKICLLKRELCVEGEHKIIKQNKINNHDVRTKKNIWGE